MADWTKAPRPAAVRAASRGSISCSVSVMGGITFTVKDEGSGTTVVLEGFVRLNGRVEILGIITISVEFLEVLDGVGGPSWE